MGLFSTIRKLHGLEGKLDPIARLGNKVDPIRSHFAAPTPSAGWARGADRATIVSQRPRGALDWGSWAKQNNDWSQENWAKYEQYLSGYGGGSTVPMFELPELPDYTDLYRSQQQEYLAAIQAQQQEQLRQAGLRDRNDLYAQRQNAVASAVDYVNLKISEERANARLLGIDYSITDEQKASRINNYFAALWGEGDESRLEGLFKQWGKPKGFEEFVVTRGEANSEGQGERGADKNIATTGGRRPTILAEEEEETLGAKTILGAV